MCLDQLPFLEPEGIVGLPFISFGLPLLSVCFPHPYQWNVCTTANLTIQNMGRQVMVWANGDTSYFVLYLRYSPRYEKSPSCLPDRLLSDPPESKSFPFKPTYYSFYTHQVFSESNLSAPLRFWAAKVYHRGLTLRSEIYFLQILPCHARVIGKKAVPISLADDWKPQHKFRTGRTERSRRQGKICVTH